MWSRACTARPCRQAEGSGSLTFHPELVSCGPRPGLLLCPAWKKVSLSPNPPLQLLSSRHQKGRTSPVP